MILKCNTAQIIIRANKLHPTLLILIQQTYQLHDFFSVYLGATWQPSYNSLHVFNYHNHLQTTQTPTANGTQKQIHIKSSGTLTLHKFQIKLVHLRTRSICLAASAYTVCRAAKLAVISPNEATRASTAGAIGLGTHPVPTI